VAAPDHVGPYRILDVLGQGGMGIVYLADQERPIRRRVALKLIRPGMDSDQVLQRFESERQALAILSHPNVARVFDAGVSEDGRPYFVLEHVDGESITSYSDREQLPVRERVNLFLQTCDALEHAHRTGIIHRDVKPSNVLVCREGDRATVKVIDFGVAKALHQKLTDRTLHTRQGLVLGTPEYMSPEQAGATSTEVDARADVYSLGVVLYELLVGALPFDPQELRVTSDVEMLRKIREVDPPRPSARLVGLGPTAAEMARRRATDLPTLTRLVSGELAWITLKALEKDPGRRYASATELAADLRRFLADRPVLARPQTAWYRVWKLVRRNRGAAFAMAGIVLALAAGAGAALVVLRSDPKPPSGSFGRMQLTRLTSTGNVIAGAISPNGRHAAYVRSEPVGNSVWIQPLPTGAARQLVAPIDGEYWSLSFSADGESFFYITELRLQPVGGVLYEVSLNGGTPRTRITGIAMVRPAPDGRRLLIRRWQGTPRVGAILLTTMDGTVERALAVGNESLQLLEAAWSPDSRAIVYAFSDRDAEGAYWGLAVRSLDDDSTVPIVTKLRSQIRGPVWLPDRGGLVVTVSDDPVDFGQLWHVSYPDGVMTRMTRDLNAYRYPQVTADGRTIIAIRVGRPARIWIAPRDDPGRARPVVTGVGEYGDLAWGPDGTLVYALATNPERNLWALRAAGGAPRQLTANSRSNWEPDVTPDGRHIVFLSNRNGDPRIWRIDADGSNAVQLSSIEASSPQCTPDGRWVVFRRSIYDVPTLWKVPIEGGAPVPLMEDASFRAAFSPDGRWLAHEVVDRSRIEPRVVIRLAAGGPPVRVLDVFSDNGPIRFSPESDGIVYIGSGDADLLFQPIEGGPPRVLVHSPYESLFEFDLAPDGKQIAYTSGAATSDAVLLQNLR